MGASTQSVLSALVGIQDYRDDSFSLSSKIIDYFPEYAEYFENIPQKDQIELRHLLAHSSGFWWDEETYPFGTDENDAYQMSISDDWVANVLSTPMIKEPGADFNFNSGNAILMGAILEKQTGQDLEEFASAQLFSPLGIEEWKWDRISGGQVNAAWGLYLRPLDMAKIGHLYIEEGLWKENQIFADNWTSRSSRSRFYASSYFNYGYFWWRFGGFADVVRYLERNDIFFSWGEGGQFIFIVPHLDLVVVTTAGNYNNNETLAIDMFRDYILPSVVPRPF
jgi:CubicO group peptidase (beta-lactamase class C family)